ncbi:serine/threonine protein kinase [Naegleria gruberi]|uniref:Serine/threonine protein kinase n=1 Tax=Naegleria gruberi TaxID=5762 RepID=D2VWE7_NAEGR|nr:serine/threonine protein kinase [Naegleria gruberi]EFC38824.1 serine/threonine protein kinase [Naegleria gruberi]|eukprot:XP_002671568.1 serine/threonine protein kinase [Naegleria gruberi strain NEG-M]
MSTLIHQDVLDYLAQHYSSPSSKEQLIATGTYGAVYKILKNNNYIALKIMRHSVGFNINEALGEAVKMAKYKHKRHIVRIDEVFIVNECKSGLYLCIEMEFCEFGTLSTIFRDSKPSEQVLCTILKQICLALKEIQEGDSIVHNDIKANNILVRSFDGGMNIDVALTDFGLSFSVDGQNHDIMSLYPPPEEVASFGSDIFTLGACMYKLMIDKSTVFRYGNFNFANLCQDTKFEETIIRDLCEIGQYSQRLATIIISMMNKEVSARPNIDTLLNWLETLDESSESVKNEQEEYILSYHHQNSNNEECEIASDFDKKRRFMMETVIRLTGAQHEIRLETQYFLKREFKNIDDSTLLEYQRKINDLLPLEQLVDKTIYQRNRTTNAKFNIQFAAHKAAEEFAVVSKMLESFHQYLLSLKRYGEKALEWVEKIQKLEDYYSSYATKLRTITSDFEFYQLTTDKAILMSEMIEGFFSISQDMALRILSLNERGESSNSRQTESNHRVRFLPEKGEPEIYFKPFTSYPPLSPSREFALNCLYHKIQIETTFTGLIVIDNVKKMNSYWEHPFFVQISQAIEGYSGISLVRNKLPLCTNHFSQQVIGALITSPSDGKFDNFIMKKLSNEKYGLISIDNDEIFRPSVLKNKYYNVKSFLFLLKEMNNSVDSEYRIYLDSLIPEMILLEWTHELARQEDKYKRLWNDLEFMKCKFDSIIWEDFDLSFSSFSESTATTIMQMLKKIQNLLKENKHSTLKDLFSSCYPLHSKVYEEVSSQYESLDDQYYAVHNYQEEFTTTSGGSDECYYFYEHDRMNVSGWSLFHEYILSQVRLMINYEDAVLQFHSLLFMKNKLSLTNVLVSLSIMINDKLVFIRDVKTACNIYAIGLKETYANFLKEWKSKFQPFLENNPDLKWACKLEDYFPRVDYDNDDKRFPYKFGEMRGAFMGKRYLSKEMERALFNNGEFMKDNTLTGRSSVNKYPAKNPIFFFKKCPEMPVFEHASTLFMRIMGLTGIPRCEFVIFSSHKERFPILISEAVNGLLVLDLWNAGAEIGGLDRFNTGLLIVCSMLLNPEDQKEDNFILAGNQLVPIDNEHVFLPGSVLSKTVLKVIPQLQTKSLIFCVNEMKKSLHRNLVQQIISMNVDQFLQQWMGELVVVNDKYSSLFTKEESDNLWENKEVTVRLVFSPIFIENLFRKFHLLQKLLVSYSKITPVELLCKLEPYVGEIYRDSFVEKSVKRRFMLVTDTLYKKKKIDNSRISVHSSKQIMEIINIDSATIKSESEKFNKGPTNSLEQLKILQSNHSHKNQEIIPAGKTMSTKDQEQYIKKVFTTTSPVQLVALNSNILNSQHISNHFFIEKLPLITSLDLRGCKNLQEESLFILQKYCVNVEYLNISEWKLKIFGHFTRIERFVFSNDIIETDINIPIFPYLQILILDNIPTLKSITLSLPSLISFQAVDADARLSLFASNLRHIKISCVPKLINYLLTFQKDLKLEGGIELSMDNYVDSMSKLVVDDHLNLSKVFLEEESFPLFYLTITCMKFRSLKTLSIEGRKLSQHSIIIISQMKNLTSLNVSNTQIDDPMTQIISTMSNIENLSVSYNQIGDDGIEYLVSMKNLQRLDVRGNLYGSKGSEILTSHKERIQIFMNARIIQADQITIMEQVMKKNDRKCFQGMYQDKMVLIEMIDQTNNFEHYKQQDLWLSLDHPNISRLIGSVKLNDSELYITDLANYNLKEVISSISLSQKLEYLIDIAKGMNYLHSLNPPVAFRDLRLSNIIISENEDCAKIYGFDLATNVQKHMSILVGSYVYIAPEVLKLDDYSEKCDVYSFAILLWEVVMGIPTFDSYEPIKQFLKRNSKYVKMTINIEQPTTSLEILKRKPPCIPFLLDSDYAKYSITHLDSPPRKYVFIPELLDRFVKEFMFSQVEEYPENLETIKNVVYGLSVLATRCWENNSNIRPSFREILENLTNLHL